MSCRGCATARPPERVCFFGTYAREYTATRLLRQACRAAGVEVLECHRPLWEQTRLKDARYFGPASVARLLLRYAGNAAALARERRRLGAVPLYVVGFNGQFDCLLLHWLTRRHPVPIVFAPLITLTETLIEDRTVVQPRSGRAALVRLADRLSLSRATQVVIDTEAHRQYLLETFHLPPARVSTWYLGADPEVFRPSPLPSEQDPLQVLFYGSFLPLHGVETVLEAAALLKHDRRIRFVLVGDGPGRAASVAYARRGELAQIEFIDWVAYQELGHMVAAADICLGIFGTTRKAQMVIPNKVYQAAAAGRPVITADTPAAREVFAHGDTAWLCPAGDPAALARAIRTLCADRGLRQRLGVRAAALMADRFSPAVQGQKLAGILAAASQP